MIINTPRSWLNLDTLKNHDSLKSIKPLMFETGVKEYPHSYTGTCFVVEYRSRIFVLSAQHCFHGYEGEHPVIDVEHGAGEFIPLCREYRVIDHPTFDNQFGDIIIFESPIQEFSAQQRARLKAFDLDSQIGRQMNMDHGRFVFQGYPKPYSEIDYEKFKITRNPMLSDAYFEGPSTTGCLWFTFPKPKIDTISGVSGSPVFQYYFSTRFGLVTNLVGMIFTGSVESQRIQIIETNVLLTFLDRMISQIT